MTLRDRDTLTQERRAGRGHRRPARRACDEPHVVALGGCSVRLCPPARRSPTTISTRAGSAATGARWRSTSPRTARQWHEVMTEHERARRAVELRDVLPRRGRRRRRPRAVHRRRPARGAEVLPRHPAGRRGAPRDLLQALHGRGRRARRRVDRGHACAPPSPSSPGASARPSRCWTRSPARCARTAQPRRAGAGGDDVPPRRRGAARAAGPALHLRLPEQARAAARLPRGHAAGRAGRAAPHRLRRQAPARPRTPRIPACARRSRT